MRQYSEKRKTQNTTTQYTTKLDFPAIIFPHRGTYYFLIRLHKLHGNLGPRIGKITSLPNGEKRHQLHRGFFAYNESGHYSYPQFSRSLLVTPGTMADHLGKTDEKKENIPPFLECRSAKASSTNKLSHFRKRLFLFKI